MGLQDSISSVLRTLSVEDEVPPTRPRIITKYDFMQTRDKKSHLDLPPEFVISTDLQVSHQARDPQVTRDMRQRTIMSKCVFLLLS